MPEKGKLVFQGGGARLAAIIPAADAIRQLVADDNDRAVVAAAGASADSFGAVLIALPEADIQQVKAKLLALSDDEIQDAMPSMTTMGKFGLLKAARLVLKGEPMVQANRRRLVILEAFRHLGIDARSTFESLGIDNVTGCGRPSSFQDGNQVFR